MSIRTMLRLQPSWRVRFFFRGELHQSHRIIALQSIYGEDSVRLWSATRRNADQDDSRPSSPSVEDPLLGWLPGDRVRFEILTT